MNIGNRNGHDKALLDEREWQAQENALRDERLGIGASGDDPLVAGYRTVARALREAPEVALPADFARDVARAAVAQGSSAHIDARLEQILLRLLVVALVLSGTAALAFYGNQALLAIDARLTTWGLALATCMALTWAFDWLRRIRHDGDPLHPA
ncbi:hypothetical protein IP90_00257 [Luteimonas cucumeris]|uniref:Uncharacterized protein n=1 Tax=Luteimonas cucumeris TaxID=985012 RepID=A0A562LEK7_9GAMM|nr:hypothetical protein [Luteimonas cucumeris]TWI05995.1 hypothetical protein IP90_00257 [Luteimonas cucumeris]